MLYPPAIMFPPGHQGAYLELLAPGQDSFLASTVYIIGRHIVQGFVMASLVVVADKLGNRCPKTIRTKRDHQANVVFQRPVQALDLTDGLRVMGSGGDEGGCKVWSAAKVKEWALSDLSLSQQGI